MSKVIRAFAVMAATAGLVVAVADGQEPPAKDEMKAKPGMDKMMKAGAGNAKELPKLDAGPSAQDAIFFSSDGPVRVRYTATIDGRPTETVWREALGKVFAFCDRNGDGTLDARERAAFNRPRMAYSFVDAEGFVHTTGGRTVTFQEKASKVDKAAFLAAFRSSEMAAVTLTTKPARNQTDRVTNSLFKRLDTSGDGKLSSDELKAARERLQTFDVNDDELVTTQELLGRGYGNEMGGYFVTQSFSDGNTRQPIAAPADFLFPSADPGAAAKEVLAARDKNEDGALSKDELGVAKGPCPQDRDGDGKVTESELIAWLRTPPDLEFALDFGDLQKAKTFVGKALEGLSNLAGQAAGKANGLTLLQPRGEKSPFADRAARDGGDVRLRLTDSRVRFTANRDLLASLKANWQGSVQNVKTQFDQLAGDKKVIDRKQYSENPQLNEATALFDLGDRNADGKLTAEEVDDAVATLAPLIGCRVEVSVTDHGRGLFELIDTDGDSRLSPRELAAAASVLKALDRNADGLLDKNEVPRNFVVEAIPSSANAISFNQFYFDAAVFGAPAAPTVARANRAPDWFNKMDRNGDGDLSRREFLGPLDLFKKLDADGDGLLSADEARAAKEK